MIWNLDSGWLMMAVATVAVLAFFFGAALDAIMREDGFGPTGNMILFTAGFFIAVIAANTYGISLRDLKLAVAWGLGGAFVLVSLAGARESRPRPGLTVQRPTIHLDIVGRPACLPQRAQARCRVNSWRAFARPVRGSGDGENSAGAGSPSSSCSSLLDAGGRKEVEAAHDMGDALQRIVGDHRQMIAGRDFPARQHDVAPILRARLHRAFADGHVLAGKLAPRQRAA